MTTHKKLSARILSMALSVALVCTMLPTTALAAEGDTPLGASSINTVGTIKSFDKLEDRFSPSTGTNAPDHVYSLSVALNKPVEELQLPSELSAMVEITTTKPAEDVKDSGNVEETTTTTAQKNVAVSWNSDKEYKSDVNGQLIYTAVLPEGYTLADGVNLPQIYVMVGRQARATGDAITITVNGSTTAVGGATLQAVVEANGGATAVTSLKITAGEVTTADWEYLKNLTILTSFEIDSAVRPVADIPTKDNTLFPKSIVSVTVPQAIAIGDLVFNECTALTTASFLAATSIGMNAFSDCAVLTTASFPAVTSISNAAFYNCTSLTTASFPAVTSISGAAFYQCTALATLKLGAAAPTVENSNAFANCPATRALGYLAADGTALTGTALTNAQAAYKAASDGSTTDEKWYGWTIAAASTHVPVTGITGVPTTATVGTNLTLSGTVAPTTATNKTIVWSVKTAGNTGATISGSTLSTTAAGTVVVTATITNGKTASTNYTQDFTITVSAASTPSPTIEIIIGGNYVCGNGTPLVIEKEGTGTTIYIDTNENGVKDSGEKSLADEEIANAPVNGADLSTWRIYGGSNTAEVTGNTLVTMNDGEINTLCAGNRSGNINGNVHLTVNGGKISGWQLITGNANGGTITGNSTIEINDGEIKIVMVGSPNNAIINGNCTVTIKGGTITGQLMNNGTINGTKTVTITGGACTLNKLSGITPTNVGGEELEFYKFTLSDATSTEIVNSITLVENYAYNLNGVAATATLGVFLPKTGKTFTKATVSTDLSTYAGSISNKAATLVKTVYTPVTGITSVPTTATAGTALTLSGIVAPATATNKTIVWSVKTQGTTGASISGSTLSTTAAGTVVVTATITNGKTASTNYTQDFTITVSAPKTPASIAVTTAPTKTAYTAGETFNKAGMVVTATYIDSTTAAVSGYTFSPATALTTTDTTITITYTENGTTVTTTQAITVSGGGGSGGGGGGSSSGGGTTTPAGGTAGGTNTPGKTVIDNPVGSTGSTNPLAEAVKNATAAGTTNTTAYVNYANYTALTVDGLKAINDAAAAAVKDKNVQLSTKIQLDNTVGNVVLSRVTVDPAKLTAVMPDKLGLSVWFDQQKDTQVTAVKDKFERAFSNKLITITFEQKTPLAVNMELALKPDLSELNTKNLYFYSYNPETNLYNRVWSPAYWVDKNGYSHITAPFGGSIIITDTPLTLK